MEKDLIENHLEQFQAEFGPLLESRRDDDLARMYKVFYFLLYIIVFIIVYVYSCVNVSNMVSTTSELLSKLISRRKELLLFLK